MDAKSMIIYCVMLVIVTCQVEAQTTCANNGGCSHHCLYRGTGNRTCGCPCGMSLDASATNCVASATCDVDLYILVDQSMNTDPINCILSSPTYPGWISWRTHVTNTLNFFVDDNAGSRYNVGVQTFSQNIPTTINTYNNTVLQPAVNTLLAATQPICLALVKFISPLTTSIETFPTISNFVYRGPGVRRSPATTSRIAIVMTAGPAGAMTSTISARLPTIMTQMDDILVITLKNLVDNSPGQLELNTALSSTAACGNSSAPCGDVFYFDDTNSDDLAVTETNLKSKMNLDACLSRQATPSITMNCGQTMTATVPKCLLQGMTISDLSYYDSLCQVTGTESGGNYVINIPFIGCGIKTKMVEVGGAAMTNFTQMLRTANFTANQTLPSVSIPTTCLYAAYVEPAVVVNVTQNLTGSTSASTTIGLTTTIYKDNFTTAYTPADYIPVDTIAWVQASSGLTSQFTLKLWSLYATPSPSNGDPTKYYMVTNGCPVDPTLSVLPSASSAVRFKYNVFEFVTTRTLANSNKLPVYFHMIFAACTSSDTSAPCTATCTPSGRRRRSLEEPKIPHASTIGPFRVGSPVERPSNQQPLQVLIRRGKHVNYFSNFNLLLVAIGVVVMIELLLARRSKVATKDTKAVDFQCTEIVQPLEKKVGISNE